MFGWSLFDAAGLWGSIVFIVAFYSKIILKHSYNWRRWFSILAVAVGVSIVGVASVKHSESLKNKETTVFGATLIVLAQFI
jgi:drug/metabolite transporter (DMT)-like permease